MRILSAVFLSVAVGQLAHAQLGGEAPECYITKPILQASQSSITNTLRANAQDNNGPSGNPTGAPYILDYCLDDITCSTPANIVSGTAFNTFAYTMTGPWGTGSANVFDGAQHFIWGRMHSNFNGIINCTTGFPIPFKYNIATGAGDYSWPNLTSTLTSSVTAATLALVVSAGDTYSTGASGAGVTLVCTVGTSHTAVYDNGVVGYYITKYGVPCANVSVASGIAGMNYLSTAQANTMYAGLDPPIASGTQAIGLGFMLPSAINLINSTYAGSSKSTAQSMCSFFAFGGTVSTRNVIYSTGALQGGFYTSINNTFFQSLSPTPVTSTGIWPTMMLAWALCSGGTGVSCPGADPGSGTWIPDFATAKAAIDASFAAKGTAPTGGVISHLNSTGDFVRSASYSVSPPLAVGTNTGICPNLLNCVVSDNAAWAYPINQTNVLGLYIPAQEPIRSSNPTATLTFIAPGVGFASDMTSGSGDFAPTSPGTLGQTPCLWHLNKGAAFCNGSVDEPTGQIWNYYSELNLLMSYYTHGAPAVVAAWASSRQPGPTTFAGDPLNCPFCASAPPPAPGSSPVSIINAALKNVIVNFQ